MTSTVEICNMALGNIRAGSINDLSEASLPAEQCSLKYPILRDRMLNDGSWGFSRKIAVLATLTTEVFNWAFSYQYPTDCMKINRIIPSFEELTTDASGVVSQLRDSELIPIKELRAQVPYEVFNFSDNRVIGSDHKELRIDYVAKVTDPNLFTPDFILALSHLLAAELAIPIVGAEVGRQLRSDSMTLYQNYLAAAIASDMNENYLTPGESEFVTVRR